MPLSQKLKRRLRAISKSQGKFLGEKTIWITLVLGKALLLALHNH